MTKQDEIDRLAILMENWSLKMQLGQRDMQRLQAELQEEAAQQAQEETPNKAQAQAQAREKPVKAVK